MTTRQFLSLLRAHRDQFDWVLKTDTGRRSERRAKPRFHIRGTIRGGAAPSVILDPLRAVCYVQTGETFDSDAWSDVAEALSMDQAAADVLLSAANDQTWFWSENLRRRAPVEHMLSIRRQLLEAVGLHVDTTATKRGATARPACVVVSGQSVQQRETRREIHENT